MKLKECYRNLKERYYNFKLHRKELKLTRSIKRDYKKGKLQDYDEEIKYVLKKGVRFFPYEFADKYDNMQITGGYDTEAKLPYVEYEHKKIYFPATRSIENAVLSMKYILAEQDKASPHYYNLHMENYRDTILIDCGSAEGYIALSMIEEIDEAYIIECSEEWYEPLTYTFKPYMNKVHFIQKYVGNTNDANTCTLDSVLHDLSGKNIIIKMDIEGEELHALQGAEKVLTERKNNVFLSVCTYHNQEDYKRIKEFLEAKHYSCSASQGYCLWYYGIPLQFPYFRRGVIYARQETTGNLNVS